MKDEQKTKDQLIEELQELRRATAADDRVHHLNRVLRAIRNVNQLIVVEKTPDALIERACEILIETREYQHAWIALLDDSATPASVAEAGLGETFRDMRKFLASGRLPSCCRRALAQKEIIVVDAPLKECEGCPNASLYSDTAGIAVPLGHNGKVFGLLTIAAQKRHVEDEEEIALLQELAGDLGLALHGIELDQARKRAEEALRKSEEMYRRLFENMSEGVAIYEAVNDGEDFVFVDYNKAGQSMDGVGHADAVGRRVTEVFPSIKTFGLLDVLQRVWATGEPERHPTSLYREESVVFYRENYVFKLLDGQIVAVYTDETDRVQAKETLRQSEELLKVTLRSIGDAVIATDDKGRVTSMNPTAEELTGWGQEEAAGRPLDKVFDIRNEETDKRVESPLKRFFREGVVVGLANHTKLIRRDGTELPIADSGAPIKDDQGKTIGAVLVFRDITEHKRAEEKREQFMHDSEERVKELEGLYEISKMALESSNKEEFFQRTAEIVPKALQYPKRARCRLVFDEKVYVSEPFEPTQWKQAADILVGGERRGELEVYYRDDPSEQHEGPFVAEKRALISGITNILGLSILGLEGEESLRVERDRLTAVFAAMVDGVYVVDRDFNIEFVNDVLVEIFGPYEDQKCYSYFHDREEICPWCKNEDVWAGKTVRWEWYSDKASRTYDLIDTPLRNVDGSISKLEIF